MNAYRGLIEKFLDELAVCNYSRWSWATSNSRHPKWQDIKRVEEMGGVKYDQILEQLDDSFPVWYESIVDPLVGKICRTFYPDRFVDGESGPAMGICSRVHVSLLKNEFEGWREREEELKRTDGHAATEYYMSRYEGNNMLSLAIVPIDLTEGLLGITDYNVDTKSYPRGTIGEINGMNHPDIHIPISASLEWFEAQITRVNVRR